MARPLKQIALTGATGFVGHAVLRRLISVGYPVRCLAPTPGKFAEPHDSILLVAGNLGDDRALSQLVDGAWAVIHLVGIIRPRRAAGQTFERVHHEGTVRLLEAARAGGVKRWVHMSALGTGPEATCPYYRTKWLAEQALRHSALDWTIFRPALIHGPRGEFMRMLRGFWQDRLPPFVPYFGAGLLGLGPKGKVQPIWVEDVARGFVDALGKEETIGQTYPMVGPHAMTWARMYEICRGQIPRSRRKPICPIPAWLALGMARLAEAADSAILPFGSDQVIMSQQDNVADPEAFSRDLGFEPRAFEEALRQYAGQIL